MEIVSPYVGGKNILAVDLGINGGFCVSEFGKPMLHKMPSDDIKRAEWIKGSSAALIVAENVRIFPGFSIKAGATFMIGRGFLQGVAACCYTPVEWIEPMTWIECYTLKRTKHFKNKDHWKKHLLEVAKSICPKSIVNEICLKTCDAFLMWNYIARRESGNPMKRIGVT